jgi:hypothetical protein
VTCDGFFSGLLEVSNLIFCSGNSRVWENVRDASRFISHHKEEWRGIMGVMLSVVVDELCHGKVLDPIERCGAAVNAEIGF